MKTYSITIHFKIIGVRSHMFVECIVCSTELEASSSSRLAPLNLEAPLKTKKPKKLALRVFSTLKLWVPETLDFLVTLIP